MSSFESDSANKNEESDDNQSRLPRKCKTKSKEKPTVKEVKEVAKKQRSGRTSEKSGGLFANAQVVEFINGPAMKNVVFEDEASLQKEIIDKMNGIAKESMELKNEKYELRFQRDKDPKYV